MVVQPLWRRPSVDEGSMAHLQRRPSASGHSPLLASLAPDAIDSPSSSPQQQQQQQQQPSQGSSSSFMRRSPSGLGVAEGAGGGSPVIRRGSTWGRPSASPGGLGIQQQGSPVMGDEWDKEKEKERQRKGKRPAARENEDIFVHLSKRRLSAFGRHYWERILILLLSLYILLSLLRPSSSLSAHTALTKARSSLLKETGKEKVKVKPRKALRGEEPTERFVDNLREEMGYIMTFPYGGLTNQLMNTLKLIYLGKLLDRVPLLTELWVAHLETDYGLYSTFFDLEHLGRELGMEVREWREVKRSPRTGGDQVGKEEHISCWGFRGDYDWSPFQLYNIRTTFWPPPSSLSIQSSIETSLTIPAIEVLVSQPPLRWLEATAAHRYGSTGGARPEYPGGKVLCFENLFYVPELRFHKGEVDHRGTIEELSVHDPVWTEVGQHLRFNNATNQIGEELLMELLGGKGKGRRWEYVAVHLRQGDFVGERVEGGVTEPYLKAVEKVQEALSRSPKSSSSNEEVVEEPTTPTKQLPVLFATDSSDPVFLAKLEAFGWIFINHEKFKTKERFGSWHPSMLDSWVLAHARGFVGTRQSTFSYVAQRRVESWSTGPDDDDEEEGGRGRGGVSIIV